MKIFSLGNYQMRMQMQTQLQNHKNVNNYTNPKAFGMRILNPGEAIKAGEDPIASLLRFLKEEWRGRFMQFLKEEELDINRIIVDDNDFRELYDCYKPAVVNSQPEDHENLLKELKNRVLQAKNNNLIIVQ